MFVSESNEMFEKSGLTNWCVYLLLQDIAAVKIADDLNRTERESGTLKAGSILTVIKVQNKRFLIEELSENFLHGMGIRLVSASRFTVSDLHPTILSDITDEVSEIVTKYEDDYFNVVKKLQQRFGRHFFRRSQKLKAEELERRLYAIEDQVQQEYRELRKNALSR